MILKTIIAKIFTADTRRVLIQKSFIVPLKPLAINK
jgi:hypothetical protein